jgi:hypothetical protein
LRVGGRTWRAARPAQSLDLATATNTRIVSSRSIVIIPVTQRCVVGGGDSAQRRSGILFSIGGTIPMNTIVLIGIVRATRTA